MTTTEKTDIRTIRTQKLIMDSFKELLNHKSFEAIRVSDISNAAEINRATFYNYYTDKYQLLDTMVEETLLVQIRENSIDQEEFSPEFIKKIYLILTGFHTNLATICQKSYIEELALYTSQVLRDEVAQTILTAIQATYPKEDARQLESFAAIISWSVIGLAYEWKRSKQQSPEQYYTEFEENYEKLFHNFVSQN